MKSNEVLNLYNNYLSTPRADWDDVKRLPTKTITRLSFNNNHQPYDDYLQKAWDNNENILFWSDQHFGHKNIIKYANRPFNNVEEMDEALINSYLRDVKAGDIVIWGGDVAFKHNHDTFKHCIGNNILILGNHDFHHNKLNNYNIFNKIHMCMHITHLVNDIPFNIIFTHYPIPKELLNEHSINVHGHIHEKTTHEQAINISVEHTQYKPICIRDIIQEKCLSILNHKTHKPSF